MIRAVMAVMAYGGIHGSTLQSVLREVASDHGVSWTVYCHVKDAAIDRARSLVLSKWLLDVDGFDAVIMIDHDMEWSTGDAARIIAKACEIHGVVGALVSKRVRGLGYGGRFADGLPHKLYSDELVRLGRDGYVGGAFTAVHRSVADRLRSGLKRNKTGFWPFYIPVQIEDGHNGEVEYLSEDWAFCRRCHDSGIPVAIDMLPRVIHHGDYGYTLHDGVNSQTCTHIRDEG